MAALRYILRRECKDGDSGAECEKPVNQTMLTVIPTAVMAGVVLVTILVVAFIIRRRRRQLKAEDLKNQDFEIDDIPPSQRPRHHTPYANSHYAQTTSTNEFSLGPPPMRAVSPARSYETLDTVHGPFPRSGTPVMNDKSNASWESVGNGFKR